MKLMRRQFTKYHITSLSRDNKNSPWSENNKNLDDMEYLKMIESGVTKKQKKRTIKR